MEDGIHFGHIGHKPSSPTLSTFAPSKILPSPFPQVDEPGDYTANGLPHTNLAYEFSRHNGQTDSVHGEIVDEHDQKRFSTDELAPYDLKPPPPTVSDANAERLAERLFSIDHLDIILKDSTHLQRFTNFLNRYRPHSVPTLVRYLESQKALTAIRYANTLADQISLHSRDSSKSLGAAIVDSRFESSTHRAVEELVSDALPAYVTYRLVTVVTECLVKEITGNNTPLMKDLVKGLAEVYCMTDPSQPDNPIVFASEEFYNTTQYGREYAIGRNCRFLQGPKSQKPAVKRVAKAIRDGQEISEILLNYRRDGSPFLNLVMMAPLMDHRGIVRYFIGCQIDISRLVEGGRGLESFKQLLDKEEANVNNPLPDRLDQRSPLKVLQELGDLLNDEEVEIVRNREGRNSAESRTSTPTRPTIQPRRYVGMDEPFGPEMWPPSQFGPSGRLPGVYQNYLLVRPYPSLRIIFTSAALRIPGLSQSKFMDRIGGPQHVREGLLDALSQGVEVTAKISWLIHSPRLRANLQQNDDEESAAEAEYLEGRPRWIHCTPLLGSDSKPGVIMVVMVDREEITGCLNSASSTPHRTYSRLALRPGDYTKEAWPLKGMPINDPKFTGSKLYAEYLRREGRSNSMGSRMRGREEESRFNGPGWSWNSSRMHTRPRRGTSETRRPGIGHGTGGKNGIEEGEARIESLDSPTRSAAGVPSLRMKNGSLRRIDGR